MVLYGAKFLKKSNSKARLDLLPRTAECQGFRRYIMCDHGTRSRHGPRTDSDWCDKHRVGTDEGMGADLGPVLHHAVVVAGHGARADVRMFADMRVAKIGQVADLHAFVEDGVLDFHEIADRLRLELREHGKIDSDRAWDEIQVKFLTLHKYFTKTAKDMRDEKKAQNLKEIKERLKRDEYND